MTRSALDTARHSPHHGADQRSDPARAGHVPPRSFRDQERRYNSSHAEMCKSVAGTMIWQDLQDCVQTRQLCQTSPALAVRRPMAKDRTATACESRWCALVSLTDRHWGAAPAIANRG